MCIFSSFFLYIYIYIYRFRSYLVANIGRRWVTKIRRGIGEFPQGIVDVMGKCLVKDRPRVCTVVIEGVGAR